MDNLDPGPSKSASLAIQAGLKMRNAERMGLDLLRLNDVDVDCESPSSSQDNLGQQLQSEQQTKTKTVKREKALVVLIDQDEKDSRQSLVQFE